MSSCRALAVRLRRIAARLPVHRLRTAALRADEAAAHLATAQGKDETPLATSIRALHEAASTARASADRLQRAANWVEFYCTVILGVAADAPTRHGDPGQPTAETSGDDPSHARTAGQGASGDDHSVSKPNTADVYAAAALPQ